MFIEKKWISGCNTDYEIEMSKQTYFVGRDGQETALDAPNYEYFEVGDEIPKAYEELESDICKMWNTFDLTEKFEVGRLPAGGPYEHVACQVVDEDKSITISKEMYVIKPNGDRSILGGACLTSYNPGGCYDYEAMPVAIKKFIDLIWTDEVLEDYRNKEISERDGNEEE
jgi:hypothetical protein